MPTARTQHWSDPPQPVHAGMPSRDAENGPVNVSLIGGDFSVIDDAPLDLTAVPGMTLRVNKGDLWVTGAGRGEKAYIRAGDRYVSEQVGVLTLLSARRAELRIAMP